MKHQYKYKISNITEEIQEEIASINFRLKEHSIKLREDQEYRNKKEKRELLEPQINQDTQILFHRTIVIALDIFTTLFNTILVLCVFYFATLCSNSFR
jgi:hypothetical protein